MLITGDANATLKDLTRIFEAEIMEADVPLYPRICSMVESADQAYIKIPIQTRVPFPIAFDGERKPASTEVTVAQTYNKGTYALTLDFNSDLMRESKAYEFSDKVQEGAMSAKIFPSYNLTQMIIGNGNAYDGVPFYAATGHYYAKSGKNLINNTLAQSGLTVTNLYTDLENAVANMRTFLDDKGRLLNPQTKWGADQFVVHCPVKYGIQFRQLVFGSLIPIQAPVTASGTAAVTATGPKELGLNGIVTIIEDGYLDSAPTVNGNIPWYLHYVGAPQRPFVYTESYGLQARALGFGSEHETNTNQVRITTKQRFLEGFYRFDRSIRVA